MEKINLFTVYLETHKSKLRSAGEHKNHKQNALSNGYKNCIYILRNILARNNQMRPRSRFAYNVVHAKKKNHRIDRINISNLLKQKNNRTFTNFSRLYTYFNFFPSKIEYKYVTNIYIYI